MVKEMRKLSRHTIQAGGVESCNLLLQFAMSSNISRKSFLHLCKCLLAGCVLSACGDDTPGQSNQNQAGSGTRPTTTTSPVSEMPTIENPEIVILADGLDFPEGPAFDPSGNLWCSEMNQGNLIQWSQGQIERFPTQGKPNSLAFDRQGRAWICDSAQNAIRRLDPVTQTWETIADQIDGNPLQTPNDLAFDALGNVIFSCPNYADERKIG